MISKGIQLEQLFQDYLSLKTGTGKATAHSFEKLFGRKINASSSTLLSGRTKGLQSLRTAPGKQFLQKLKGLFQSLGLQANQISANPEALTRLRNMLLQKGFDPETIQSLFASMQSSAKGKSISLSGLLAKLTETDDADLDENRPFQLSSAAVPYLQGILSELGLDPGTIDAALSYSKTHNGSIQAQRLVDFLQGVGLSTGVPKQTKTSLDQLTGLMKQIGMPVSSQGEADLTLPQFVSRLERMIYENAMGMRTSEKQFEEEFSGFLHGLSVHDIFSDNPSLSEKMARLAGLDPLKPAGGQNNARHAFHTGSTNNDSLRLNSMQTGNDTSQGFSLERQAQGQKIQNLLIGGNKESSDTSFNPSLLDQMKATARESRKQDASTGLENGVTGAAQKQAHSLTSGKDGPGKPLPAYVLNQVSRQIVRSMQDGLNEIRLQLKPPHLGRLQIHMKHATDGLKVSILAENNTAHEILKTHSAELKSILIEHGIRLEKIDVQISFHFDQSMSQAKQDFRKSNEKKEAVFRLDEAAESMDERTGLSRLATVYHHAGTVNLVA